MIPLFTLNELKQTINYISTDWTEQEIACINTPINNPAFLKGFGAEKGGKHGHHAYEGGLVNHTSEVLTYSLDFARSLPNVNIKILAIAAIWHDYCKIFDYDEHGKGTIYRTLIRHLSGSFAEFMKYANENTLSQDLIIGVGHCILAHHGRQEWGSPVLPQTVEAFILHSADMLSCQYGPSK